MTNERHSYSLSLTLFLYMVICYLFTIHVFFSCTLSHLGSVICWFFALSLSITFLYFHCFWVDTHVSDHNLCIIISETHSKTCILPTTTKFLFQCDWMSMKTSQIFRSKAFIRQRPAPKIIRRKSLMHKSLWNNQKHNFYTNWNQNELIFEHEIIFVWGNNLCAHTANCLHLRNCMTLKSTAISRLENAKSEKKNVIFSFSSLRWKLLEFFLMFFSLLFYDDWISLTHLLTIESIELVLQFIDALLSLLN